MNPFTNPLFLLRIAKSYISDVNRIWNTNPKKMKKYQDKAFRKIVRYAFSVPLYYDKYKEHGIHLRDINGIDDIHKLPFISKEDLREYYPDGIIPKRFDKKHGFKISTSGSTGKPVVIYYDAFTAIKSLEGFVRILKAYGGNWRKSKIVMIIDMSPDSIEHAVFKKSTMPFLKNFLSLKNIKYIDIGEKPENIITKLDSFNPEFIASDPYMLRELAYLKSNNFGKNIQPKYIFSGGAMLDSYTKKYVENAFNTKILDTYGTTEAGPLAFECIHGDYYHINSDFVYLECLDENNKPVSYGNPGHIVVTKLYGKGTPIIRYTGFDDIVTPIKNNTICGISTPLIQHIEGRCTDIFVLPDNKLLSPLTVTGIPAKVMEEFNSYKIKQFQIIQHTKSEIEVLLVIDEQKRNIGISVEKLFNEIQKRFTEKIGSDVNIIISETDEISKKARVAISKVKQK